MTSDTYGVNPLAPNAPPRPTPQVPTTRTQDPVSYEGDALTYDGQAGKLWGLGVKLTFLSLLTLGFYRFWGKTQIRRYLWSRISLLGDRFEYTGTGKELFLGFLIALCVLIPLGALSHFTQLFLAGKSIPMHVAVIGTQYVVILFLVGYATFRARRYRLSRTVFRGIRFWQTGSNVGYALRMLGYYLLTIVTLGIAGPVGDIALHRYLMQHTWFGSQKFDFDGRASEMMGKWILAMVLMPFTLGLSLVWYSAFRIRYLAGQTRYQSMGFSLPVTFGNLAKIVLPFYLVLLLIFAIVSGGVGASAYLLGQSAEQLEVIFVQFVPIISILIIAIIAPVLQLVMLTHRFIRLVAERMEFTGDFDLDAIMQSAAQRPQSGEGLADALDIGGGLEVGI